MRLVNLIILSLMVCIAGLSSATTELVDPTRPATFVDVVEKSTEQNSSEQTGEEKQVSSESKPDFRLNAIKIGRLSRLAIINGESVSPGQKIGSATLVKINSDSVVIDVNGRGITISLLPDSIKTRSSK